MHSSMIGKIEKAMRYAQQRDRIHFNDFTVTIEGDHRSHTVSYHDGQWRCDGEVVEDPTVSPHVMTIERVLGEMIAPPSAEDETSVTSNGHASAPA